MSTIDEQIARIQNEIRKTPYHKGTEHHIGRLRAKLSRLKDQLFNLQTKGKGGSVGFAVKKHGDATVVLVGPPSVGKSTLLNKLTNAKSRQADYAFTTVTVIPGMMKYNGANIQILDIPGLIEGASRGKGRGREVLSVVKTADLLIIIAAKDNPGQFRKIEKELEKNGIRLNQKPEDNLDIYTYKPAIYVLSKSDLTDKLHKARPYQEKHIVISAKTGEGLERLKKEIWRNLELTRVYLKKNTKTTDYNHPMLFKGKATLKDVLARLGKDFAQNKKEAKIWGPRAKYPGQRVPLRTNIQDKMEVFFI